MMTQSRWGKLKVLGLALPLVPAFFALEHVGTEGFPEALGCSGNGSGVAPFPGVTVLNPRGTPTVAIASDGFFLLTTTGYLGNDPLQTVQVTVTSTDNQVVPGQLALLENNMLSWQADEALPIGTKLQAVADVSGATGAAPTNLEVVGEPTKLATGDFSLRDWVDFRHGVGDLVSCPRDNLGGCSGGTIQLPGTEESLRAVNVRWKPPSPINGMVAWQAHVELPSGYDLIGQNAVQYRYADDPGVVALPLGLLVFPKDTTEYCAVLVVRDLRTGLEQRLEQCTEPGVATATERDTLLASCSAPPTPENAALTRAWCELYPTHAACTGMGDGPTVPDGPVDDDPPTNPDVVGTMADDSPRTSSGCQLAPGAASNAGFGALLAALGLTLARRRR